MKPYPKMSFISSYMWSRPNFFSTRQLIQIILKIMRLFVLLIHFNYIKLRLPDPCLRMISNVQCLTVKYNTIMTINHVILIWFKSWNKDNWAVEVLTWNRIGFLPGVTNCEDEVCISCKLSLSSLTGSAGIFRFFFFFWFYQFVSFYLHSSKNVRISELNNKQSSWLIITMFLNQFLELSLYH